MYEKMYHTLFHAITDAMELMEEQRYQEALFLLEKASREAEEIYISEKKESRPYGRDSCQISSH